MRVNIGSTIQPYYVDEGEGVGQYHYNPQHGWIRNSVADIERFERRRFERVMASSAESRNDECRILHDEIGSSCGGSDDPLANL